MIVTSKKCDRCKTTTNQLINIQIVNPNEKIEPKPEPEQGPFMHFFNVKPTSEHPTINKEVCIDCAKQLCRWIDHSENLLTAIK